MLLVRQQIWVWCYSKTLKLNTMISLSSFWNSDCHFPQSCYSFASHEPQIIKIWHQNDFWAARSRMIQVGAQLNFGESDPNIELTLFPIFFSAEDFQLICVHREDIKRRDRSPAGEQQRPFCFRLCLSNRCCVGYVRVVYFESNTHTLILTLFRRFKGRWDDFEGF